MERIVVSVKVYIIKNEAIFNSKIFPGHPLLPMLPTSLIVIHYTRELVI